MIGPNSHAINYFEPDTIFSPTPFFHLFPKRKKKGAREGALLSAPYCSRLAGQGRDNLQTGVRG
jgi:hypothetical protein